MSIGEIKNSSLCTREKIILFRLTLPLSENAPIILLCNIQPDGMALVAILNRLLQDRSHKLPENDTQKAPQKTPSHN